ncbi:alpha/beta hydrolase [Limnobacter humi]|uniref:Alpha/beta hydrolase n=1 Tax=Limnobacter humi TaxID=1778671 RepID=A0ABT1WHY6_9BURK|nr:alpha/beta hydrolase [Limnobacter humi]MCQ8896483.1 alpha/beta hydrolase [Limnobacter humi]
MYSIDLPPRVTQSHAPWMWLAVALLGALLLGACKTDALPLRMVYSGNGVHVSIAEYGNPQGPPVLFIHGLAESGEVWQAQTQAPELQGYRLITLDLRGHGQSSKPMEPSAYMSANPWADDIFAVVHRLGLRDITVVAHGHGAAVALDYLALYGEQRVRAVMLVDAIVQSGPSYTTYPGFQHLTAPAQAEQIAGVLALAADNLGPTSNSTKDRTAYGRWVAMAMLTPVPVRRYVLGRSMEHQSTLQRLRVPLVFAHGEQDPVVPLPSARSLAASAPGATLTVFHDSWHAPFVTEAPAFNAALTALIQHTVSRS